MKKQIRIIFILVSISVLGMLAFQAYWIYNSFRVEKTQVKKDIDQIIESSVQELLSKSYSDWAELLFSNKNVSVIRTEKSTMPPKHQIDSVLKILGNQTDSSTTEVKFELNSFDISSTSIDSMPEIVTMNIKALISSLIGKELQGEQLISSKELYKNLRQNLISRNMSDAFFLEFLNKEQKEVIETYPENSTPNSKSSLHSRAVPISIMKNHSVRISYIHVNQLILKRMIWTLLASLLLFLTVSGGYIYMLHIIFSQKRLSEVKSDFINNMTHELKTPIATVSAVVEAMQNFDVLESPEKTKKYLDVSQTELKRLSGLVEKVLNISAYENKEVKLNPEEIVLDQLIRDIVEKQEVKESNGKLSISFTSDIYQCKINFDRIHLVNIINNLIENAVKYSKDKAEVKLHLFKHKDSIQLSIRDTGIGIPKQDINRIFDKFYRVPTGNIHQVKGFGLGLHYVKNMLERHEANIQVKSTEGKGSVFTISFANE